ncbi:MAG: hypothetical protein ACD_48C00452G0002 [uncultured bacterium]|nr:MAG: hypothetical protein ACD_48C00452G0002 [uncultured bacterium]
MLIIMKNRDVQCFLQSFFNFKTAWCRNIFQIDPSKHGSNTNNRLNNFFCIFCIECNRKCIDISKLFEQKCLSFHHRKTCRRSDISQSQYRRAISHHSDHIVFSCQFINLRRIFNNSQACFCNSWCICKRKIFPIRNGHARNDFYFSFELSMVSNGIHIKLSQIRIYIINMFIECLCILHLASIKRGQKIPRIICCRIDSRHDSIKRWIAYWARWQLWILVRIPQ